jgi:hypothetical protein
MNQPWVVIEFCSKLLQDWKYIAYVQNYRPPKSTSKPSTGASIDAISNQQL